MMDVKLPYFEVERINGVRSLSSAPSWGVSALEARLGSVRENARGVVCFVIDTEAEFNHPWLGGYHDDWYSVSMTGEDSKGLGYHGLHVADHARQILETIGATKVVFGAVKALRDSGSGSQSMVANAINFARTVTLKPEHRGWARVINLSLSANSEMTQVRQALEQFVGEGGFVFAAAGNDGGAVDFPAGHEALTIAVAAGQKQGDEWQRAPFSSLGPAVDLMGPGVSIEAAWENSTAVLSGTSMASPAVMAVGVIILMNNPHIASQQELEEYMEQYALDVLEEGDDAGSGAGVPIITRYPVFDTPPVPAPEPEPDKPLPSWVWWVVALAVAVLVITLYLVNKT